MVVRGKLAAAMLIGSALFAGPSRANEAIVLASTTSVENSGLLAHILPEFTRETGISVRVLAQGTGQALATAAHGDADLVLVHDPEAEEEFIAQGHGIDRRQIAWNDFIMVGSRADPAHIADGHDAVAALTAIAAARAVRLARRQERHRCPRKAALARGRARPRARRRRVVVPRHRRRHGCGTQHRIGDGRLYARRSRHLAAALTTGSGGEG